MLKTLTEILIEFSKEDKVQQCEYPVTELAAALNSVAVCFSLNCNYKNTILDVIVERIVLSDQTEPFTAMLYVRPTNDNNIERKYILHKSDELILSSFDNTIHKAIMIDKRIREADNIDIKASMQIVSMLTDYRTEIGASDITEFRQLGKPLINLLDDTYNI